MTETAFRASLSAATPPPGLSPALLALWWAGRGDWEAAHEVVQAHEGEADCDLVHAHLHRQEGDAMNARYWYRRAGRPVPAVALAEEWAALVTEMHPRGR
ncbi:hypothetical protein [Acidisoma sp. 7E03]